MQRARSSALIPATHTTGPVGEVRTTGTSAFTTGLLAAADGSGQLAQGLRTFDSEGVAKLIDALNELDDGMGDVSDKLDALREAADGYDSFAGKTEDQTGTVRFIYKTPAIG